VRGKLHGEQRRQPQTARLHRTIEAEPEIERQTTEEEIEAEPSSHATALASASTTPTARAPTRASTGPSLSHVEASAHTKRFHNRHVHGHSDNCGNCILAILHSESAGPSVSNQKHSHRLAGIRVYSLATTSQPYAFQGRSPEIYQKTQG
jgi:endonuclease YncB( thermonuclease family)